METMSYEDVAVRWDNITMAAWDLVADLRALCNGSSPLDRRYMREMADEVFAARDELIAALFASVGWTMESFDAEVDRRCAA